MTLLRIAVLPPETPLSLFSMEIGSLSPSRHKGGGTSDCTDLEGAVRKDDGDEYAKYMQDTGIAGYRDTPGNRVALMLRRDVGENTEFVMVTLWDSLDSIKAFAGEEPERAVFYPEDDRFLIERDWTATHYQVQTAAGLPSD